jgi:hypothetical protein
MLIRAVGVQQSDNNKISDKFSFCAAVVAGRFRWRSEFLGSGLNIEKVRKLSGNFSNFMSNGTMDLSKQRFW